MKTSVKFLFLAATLITSAAATAGDYRDRGYGRDRYGEASGPYVGLSFGTLRYSEEGLDSFSPAVGLLRLGVPLAPNLAIEGRAGGGLGSTSQGGYAMEVDSLYAAYLKGSIPLGPAFSVYGVGGVAGVNLRRNFGDGESRDSGLSFGFGADFNLGRGAGINVEWTRLPTGDNAGYEYTNSMATIGMTWRF